MTKKQKTLREAVRHDFMSMALFLVAIWCIMLLAWMTQIINTGPFIGGTLTILAVLGVLALVWLYAYRKGLA